MTSEMIQENNMNSNLNILTEVEVEKLLKKIIEYFKYKDVSAENYMFSDIFDDLLGDYSIGVSGKFRGASGRERTTHENIFKFMCPWLEEQVSFGTGKGGLEKYGTKKFTADLYDRECKSVYEIDGNSHKGKIQKLKDEVRRLFFKLEYDIDVIRISNDEVENMLKTAIKKNMWGTIDSFKPIVDSMKLSLQID